MSDKHGIFTCLLLLIMTLMVKAIEVQTPSGRLQGKEVNIEGRKVSQFLNIPYAKPPIGEQRFQEPVAFGAWKGTRSATEYGHLCPQILQEFFFTEALKNGSKNAPPQSEDCLHLDVYVPQVVGDNQKLPVMFFIHGGGYSIGDSASYDGSYLAAHGNVVVVVIQYRLGVLGFISAQDAFLPGNNGLKDQILALKWVQENIASFGADPGQVTIFGESAGAFSVANHLVNAKNRGLFQRAIMQSGSNTGHVALCRNSRNGLLEFGKLAGCLSDDQQSESMDTLALLDCLRGLPFNVILKFQSAMELKLLANSMFECFTAPVVDGNIIRQHPYTLMRDTSSEEYKFFQSIDVIAGCNSFETSFMGWLFSMMEATLNSTVPETGGASEACTEALVKSFTPGLFLESGVAEVMFNRIKNPDTVKQGVGALEYLADIMFTIPMVRLLQEHINTNSRTYQYLFSHETPFDVFMARLDWVKGLGADHGTELLFLFGPQGIGEFFQLDGKDMVKLRKMMIKYWSNFAKTGNPNSDGLEHWPEYQQPQGAYLNIDMQPSSKDNLLGDRVKFLTKELPSILNKRKDEL